MTGDSDLLRSHPSSATEAPHDGAPISLQAHPGVAPDGWDDTVRALGGSIFHSALWASYRRRAGTTEPLFLVARHRRATLPGSPADRPPGGA
jgi:hypothetical protein